MLETIGPHLRAAYTRATAEARRDRRLALLERGVEHRGDAVLLVDRRGHIVAGGATARAPLEEWFGDTGGGTRLPAAVEDWRLSPRGLPSLPPLELRRADRRLRLRLIAGAEEDAILLSEHRDEPLDAGRLVGLLPITRREAEVLALLAEGHINASIAVELGLSPNTVGRHVERLYAKLDVHNRVAASRAVRDALDRS
jgi:DNA-binding CsgD family transcriptional regulator